MTICQVVFEADLRVIGDQLWASLVRPRLQIRGSATKICASKYRIMRYGSEI